MVPVLRAAVNVLVHVPDLVRYGAKPFREVAVRSGFLADLRGRLRSHKETVAYPPHQAFIGNLKPEALADIPSPWHGHPLPGASHQGPFGEILGQGTFYSLLERADLFGLLALDSAWSPPPNGASAAAESLAGASAKRLRAAEILQRIESGEALPLSHDGQIVGCVRRDHEEDESLAARILLENLAAKASGAYALRLLLEKASLPAGEVDYLLSCSEEAIGDRYNRGGGNLAKAIGEMAGCPNAAGVDIKAFCAAPVYALVHAAALVQAGVVRNAVVVGGGSLAKLGMKSHRHIEKRMPVLEDVLGGVAFWVGPDDGASPRLNLGMAGRHPSGRPSTPQGMMEALVCEPLARAGRKLRDIDKYAVELHNPEVTVPAGAGDVPLTNYRTLAALAVVRGEIAREEIPAFIQKHGMPGFAPTQGHIPAGVPYLGHALAAMRAGTMKSAMVVAKGSLFLGRMTQQADGASIVVES
ncbi:MAG: glycine/sarcosine/betaine reductase complex component C subunit beta [Nitrospinota bacterium]